MAWSLNLSSRGGPDAHIEPLTIGVWPVNYTPVQNIAGMPAEFGGLSLPPVNRVGYGIESGLGTTRVLQGPAAYPAIYSTPDEQMKRGDTPSNFLRVGYEPTLFDYNTNEGPSTGLVIALILVAAAGAFVVAKFT